MSQCFNSEVDNALIGLPKPPLRSCLGRVILNTLFATWKEERKKLEKDYELLKQNTSDKKDEKDEKDEKNEKDKKTQNDEKSPSSENSEKESKPQQTEIAVQNQSLEMSKLVPVIISDTNTGRILFYSTIGEAQGTDKLPEWVEDCVLLVRNNL